MIKSIAKLCLLSALLSTSPILKAADNLVVVTLDGLRWQELFHGVDKKLLTTESNDAVRAGVLQQFDGANSEEKRRKLMPFVWDTLAKQGSMIGDRTQQSTMELTNQWWFSYPGYNEILTGKADDSIASNAANMNDNVTILEWLHNHPSEAYTAAAFGSWEVFPAILNDQRNDFVVNAGFTSANWPQPSQKAQWLDTLQATIPSPWFNVRLDAFTMGYAKEYIIQATPNVVYIALGETDDFAHDGEYVQYLLAAQRSDTLLANLWSLLQSHPQYANNTNLLITVDHGRGVTPTSWQHHASPDAMDGYMAQLKAEFPEGIEGANEVWMMAIGPDIKAQGIIQTAATLDQIASTALTTLNLDYRQFANDIGQPLYSILQKNAAKTQTISPKSASSKAPVKTTLGDQSYIITPIDSSQRISRIGFGSCLHEDKPQPLWEVVQSYDPDLFVLLGDNVYGDTEDMAELTTKYQKLANKPEFAELRQSTPVIGIWDDHDYGANDAGKEYPLKAESKQIMLDFFGEPQSSTRRQRTDGAYTSYMLGEPGQQVHIIMPDLRYNRDPLNSVGRLEYIARRAPNQQGPYSPSTVPGASMLGEQQWQWLEQELAQPADVKIIASSIQVLSEFTGWESWHNFPADQQRLFDLVEQYALDNLFFISGDTHWSEAMQRTENGRTLIEVTSSGMTEEWKDISPNIHRTSEAYAQANFGMITIDWEQDPLVIDITIIGQNKETLIHQVLPMSHKSKE